MKLAQRLAVLFACVLASAPYLAQVDARLMRYPAVSKTQIAFEYGGDIWVCPKGGGTAERLTTAKGEESFPRFSPDGSLVAFTGNYDGNEDVYVIPARGGVPTRLTFNPSPDRAVGWTPDGKRVLTASPRESGRERFSQLYEVPVQGGLPEKLPVPYGEFGALSPDGKTLAFMPNSQDFRTWKRYRGGWVSRIYLLGLESHESRRVGDDGANYSQPMWHGDTLYLLSDRDENKRDNVWAFDLKTGALRQVTRFDIEDVHFPSIGPEEMVFSAGGRIYALDLATEKYAPLEIRVVADFSALKPTIEKVSDRIAWLSVSPSGKRAAIEARGDVFSVPAEEGVILDLTRTSGSAERYPAWSPDGKWVAYWSDRTGEYELTVRPADGSGSERTVTKLGPGYRYAISWSPDSKNVVFADQAMGINLCDVATGNVVRMDKGLFMFHPDLEGFTAAWSPDSRYVAWSREEERRNGVIFLYDKKAGKKTQLTSGFYDDSDPYFDPDGKFLYFLTKRSFDPDYGSDGTWIYANLTRIVAVPLRAAGASPLPTKNDAEGEKTETAKQGNSETAEKKDKDEKAEKPDKEKKVEPVTIDTDGFEQRIVFLPPKAGNYADLTAVAGKVLYRRPPRTGSGEEKSPILYFDLKEREEKTIIDDADTYDLAGGGEKILVAKKKDYAVIDIKADQKMEKKLPTSELEMSVDPRAEWRQIFEDAWRFERDYFYDPNIHRVNWNEMRKRYGALLDQCVTREDVNFVLGELIGEMNSSHTYRGGGDVEKPEKRGVGLLGCDFAVENGAYRIERILSGAPWDAEARSPLKEPGLDVKAGDYLLAVNGAGLDAAKDPLAAFDGLAGKAAFLTVNSKPQMEGSRQVLVKLLDIDAEEHLRYLAWVDANRQKVDKATGGKIGYIYVPDTGTDGQNELYRQFMGQYTKEGLIIDERFNSGGQIPDRFVEMLNRPVTNYWAVRDGADWQWPTASCTGPKVMLINGWSGSGGDCFPLYFRMAHVGPLIGRRTWGGLIGISGSPEFVDGGAVTVPTFAMYATDGKWLVEGHGVDPDITVEDDPAKMMAGGDPQLDRAIEEVTRLAKEKPPLVPHRPAYEDRSGK